MTTDTAARITRIIACQGIPIQDIEFVDDPEIAVNEGVEVTTMPFRYVKGSNGRPVMPRVSLLRKFHSTLLLKSLGRIWLMMTNREWWS
jgi:ribosome biogenesis SPOUT family RNA methylase Rps3